MNTIRRQDLLQLAAPGGNWRTSIYVPTHVVGEQNQQTPVRFKNLLREARERMLERGMTEDEADRLLSAPSKLTNDTGFWRTPSSGVAVLADENGVRTWQLPIRCPELVVVGKAFHVVPLIECFNGQTPYFLLAVSQNRVRLLRGGDGEVVEVPVPDLPAGSIASLGYDVPEERSPSHSASPHLAGKQSVAFHGHGGAADAAKTEAIEYLRLVDRAVSAVVQPTQLPLIFAGVDYLFPLYRQVNTTSRLWRQHICGNPDCVSTQDLGERAGALTAELRVAQAQAGVDRYWMNASGGRAEKRVEQVVRDAHAGIIESLFIDPNVQLWGRFDEVAAEIRLDDQRRRDSEDLINTAAVDVLRHGGKVETATSGYVPGGGAMAAILRYAAATTAGA